MSLCCGPPLVVLLPAHLHLSLLLADPPNYDPKVNPTLNSISGKHALGDRARKLDKGILIVRFELPFNIWCGGCNNHIGQGVRYNAEKRKVGN